MKNYLTNENKRCLRQIVLEEFGHSHISGNRNDHKCCDICAADCKCGDAKYGIIPLIATCEEPLDTSSVPVLQAVRVVNSTDKAKLKELLVTLKKEMIEKKIAGMTSVVGVQNVFLKFGWLQIPQILQTCSNFTDYSQWKMCCKILKFGEDNMQSVH